MAIRDGIALDIDTTRAAEPTGRGRGAMAGGGAGVPRPARASRVAGAVVAVVALVLASVLAYYSLRKPPEEEPRLELKLQKESFSAGDVVSVEVWLDNTRGGAWRHVLPSPQPFRLEVHNWSGGVVVNHDTGAEPSETELRVLAGERKLLGTFLWNQSVRVVTDGNETWERVPVGEYSVLAWLNGRFDIRAEKRITLV
ncbi:MAG: hypothetical protein QW379_05145 [Thermoplasmata archaeon]